MKLTILGSGTFIPELERSCSSYLIQTGKEKIIIDFGRGAIRNLLRLKINLYEIGNIFISHMHTDHSTELASFIQLIIDSPKRNKKLRDNYIIYGPIGIKKDIKNMLKTFHIDKHKNLKRIQVKELSLNKIIKIDKLIIKGIEVEHSEQTRCFSYRLKINNKTICYSGDSTYCDGLKKACKDVDIAIIEATGPPEWKMKGHINGEELGKLAQQTRIKKLIVTHVAKTYLPQVKKDIRKEYKGKFSIAKDLMKVNV